MYIRTSVFVCMTGDFKDKTEALHWSIRLFCQYWLHLEGGRDSYEFWCPRNPWFDNAEWEVGKLSYNIYIKFQIHRKLNVAARRKLGKWAIKKLNKSRLETSFLAVTWWEEDRVQVRGVEEAGNKLIRKGIAMRRWGLPKKKRSLSFFSIL